MKIVMALGRMFQDQEAKEPLKFLRDEGAQVDVVGVKMGSLFGLHGASIKVDKTFDEAKVEDYDALVIPGGRSPASLRKHQEAVDFVRDFAGTGKTIAAICHGPQMLAAAGLLKGRTITSYLKLEDEMKDAGADFVNEPVVIDANLITSRNVPDIPQFNAALEQALLRAKERA